MLQRSYFHVIFHYIAGFSNFESYMWDHAVEYC